MRLVTSATMRAIDREAIKGRGIPSEQLMENAGGGIARHILNDLIGSPSETKVGIFCGKGNNGGDGYVIGRHLHQAGVDVIIYYMGPNDKLSVDAKLNYDRATDAGIKLVELKSAQDLPESLECDIIIDAVFGTGFSDAPRGLTSEIITCMNKQECLTVAVDMPSGLNADNGRFEGVVVIADNTYTLALPKFGLFVSPGREVAGDVEIVDIGIPDDVLKSFDYEYDLTTADYISEYLPARKPDGHKGDFGRVLVVAGSTGMAGAAAMAGESALRAGAGLVRVACPQTTQPVLATKLTEVMTYPLPDVAKKGVIALRSLGEIRQLAGECDAVVLGPGLGRHRETMEMVRRLIPTLTCPTIIDADGLYALAGHLEVMNECSAPLVLTPHPGEFKRLAGETPSEDIHERIKVLRRFVEKTGVIIALKGSPTLVTTQGCECFVNPTGNHGMATGGSGDVLSGIIGTFLAQGLDALDAATCGIYIHGMAGDIAAEALTPRAMIAGDMIDYLPRVFEWLE